MTQSLELIGRSGESRVRSDHLAAPQAAEPLDRGRAAALPGHTRRGATKLASLMIRSSEPPITIKRPLSSGAGPLIIGRPGHPDTVRSPPAAAPTVAQQRRAGDRRTPPGRKTQTVSPFNSNSVSAAHAALKHSEVCDRNLKRQR
eukprot:752563-Hanusia_phi.AAC.6